MSDQDRSIVYKKIENKLRIFKDKFSRFEEAWESILFKLENFSNEELKVDIFGEPLTLTRKCFSVHESWGMPEIEILIWILTFDELHIIDIKLYD